MKNLYTFEEFLNEGSYFNVNHCKHIKFILGSSLMYPKAPFFFSFKKGTDEKEIEDIIKSAESDHREIKTVKRTYGRGANGETVLQLDKLNFAGLTWIFDALDKFYGNHGSSMGWHGEINESLNEAKAVDKVQPAAREFLAAIRKEFKDEIKDSEIQTSKPKGFTITAVVAIKDEKIYDWAKAYNREHEDDVPGLPLYFRIKDFIPGQKNVWPADGKQYFRIEENLNEANHGELFDLVKNGFGWATVEWVRQCPINRPGRIALAMSLAKEGMLFDDADLKDEHVNGEVDPRQDGIQPMSIADAKKTGL
jgi:hypothetical protein